MPRRRMLDPSFFDDTDIAKLTRDERLFLLGCIRNADDDGRLNGHPAYLKAEIFMYDDDIDLEKIRQLKDSTLGKMETWQQDNLWRLVPYYNADHDYLYFPKWLQQQKPSHPTPSKLPEPPALPNSYRITPEAVQSDAGKTPEALAPSLGQSSQGQYSIGQSSAVHEDFTKFIDNEKDLTDFLMTTLEKYVSAGRARLEATEGKLTSDVEASVRMSWGIPVLKKCWKDIVGADMPGGIFEGARGALRKYPLEVVAKAFAKGVKYKGGKHKSWKYIQTIIDEEMEKHGRSPPH